jgi:hypothetical protein
MKTAKAIFCFFMFLALLPDTASAQRYGEKRSVAMVVQLQGQPPAVAADERMRVYLEQRGFTVKMIDQMDPASMADGVDVILISSSVSARKLEGKYRRTPIPVVLWESYLLPHMGMSGLHEEVDYGTIEGHRYLWLVNAPHPLAAGRPAGLLNVYEKGAALNWARPGLGASIIATVPGEREKALVFAYEAGATMDYENLAPAARVFLFMDATFPNLNEAGLSLFDSAVQWALARRTTKK